MPHYVPFFEWSERALALRQFNYEHWCEHGHGPNLRDVHEALGYTRTEIVQTYKELALGLKVRAPQTNIVFVDDAPAGLAEHLKAHRVLVTGLVGLRFVTHMDVDAQGIDRALDVVRSFKGI